jgi:hypothetical protein
LVALALASRPNQAVQSSSALIGRWDLTLTTPGGARPSWLEIERSGPRTIVGRFVGIVGSARPISRIDVSGGAFSFSIPPQWESGSNDLRVEGRLDGDHLAGSLTDPSGNRVAWTGVRAPSLQRTAAVEWSDPIEIFNGRDTTGWHTQRGTNQWIVVDHTLTSPKSGANLVSDRTFTDFTMHVEFRCPAGSNSGVYLRGRYEVQIEDAAAAENADGRLGAIYGFLAPGEEAAKKAGEWQAFDIVLTGRQVTVILNGTTIIANQEIPGITGGAIDSGEGAPGPIMLQGDHGAVTFRNIRIRPIQPS